MSVQSFINQIAPLIKSEATRRGYKVCSTVIAQAIIESRYGESGLAKYHNYFGLKCGSSWKGASVNMKTKEEYKVGTLTTISDNFRAYPDMASGVAGYYDFIATKRYANLKTARNYAEYAQYLKSDGYATSSTYVNTLCNTVNKYDLTQYDADGISLDTTTSKTTISNAPTLHVGDKNDYVYHVQKYLAACGYSVGNIDGNYGIRTCSCVKSYQIDRGLTVDGIWGNECWNSVGGVK